jgi:Xaa-Pro aminopeptidase
MDCGLFLEHYSGDVSRTFPVNGKFSEIQKKVYSRLLSDQIAMIEAVRLGLPPMELWGTCKRLIHETLIAIGAIKTDAPTDGGFAEFFMPHGLSHSIGCTNHDLSPRKSEIIKAPEIAGLAPGMVISIEPGLYFNRERFEAKCRKDERFGAFVNREIVERLADEVGGIRIEDDVLVTDDGRDVLSTCPKTVEEIEAVMRGG